MKIQLRPVDATKSVNGNLKIHKLNLFRNKNKKIEPKSREIEVEDLSRKLLPVLGSPIFACVIKNFLSPEECSELIRSVEDSGFEDALIQGPDGEILAKDVRKCGRNIVEDQELADDWYKRTLSALEGSPLRNRLMSAPWKRNDPECPEPLQSVGLNERLRFLKYKRGDNFAPHMDNKFVRGPEHGDREGETSYVTFIIFLSNVKKGGQLKFIGCDDRTLSIDPEAGSVAIFDHDVLHEGCEVLSGVKYAVRSDVMYVAKN